MPPALRKQLQLPRPAAGSEPPAPVGASAAATPGHGTARKELCCFPGGGCLLGELPASVLFVFRCCCLCASALLQPWACRGGCSELGMQLGG